jgi:hypothetical protein
MAAGTPACVHVSANAITSSVHAPLSKSTARSQQVSSSRSGYRPITWRPVRWARHGPGTASGTGGPSRPASRERKGPTREANPRGCRVHRRGTRARTGAQRAGPAPGLARPRGPRAGPSPERWPRGALRAETVASDARSSPAASRVPPARSLSPSECRSLPLPGWSGWRGTGGRRRARIGPTLDDVDRHDAVPPVEVHRVGLGVDHWAALGFPSWPRLSRRPLPSGE